MEFTTQSSLGYLTSGKPQTRYSGADGTKIANSQNLGYRPRITAATFIECRWLRDVPRSRSSSDGAPYAALLFLYPRNTDFLDNDRTVLPDAAAIHAQAVSTAGSVLRDIGDAFWSGAEWYMIVIDEAATANGGPRCLRLVVF
jgi:hypothetical protein